MYHLLDLVVYENLYDQFLRSRQQLECDVYCCCSPKTLTIYNVGIYQLSSDHQFHR